ncbi:stage III sporulation protein AG [Desulfotomaculum arcticum]|uniref:Stage III sporulation protein AG n=1 Tax=Desulfotruncus arcticus DSM 17038 TaxID=1121424 RepID=A0A1I2MVR0_9FIRM|nr:stage III sporulation protein AG [Desulfotruncus arcticus]SFF93426.1 stage III sporulation protein AG [Desulfotomaculum arcticum] [Desulfotruncus arcticus DSM 17038]
MDKKDIFNPRNRQFWVLLLLLMLGVLLMLLGSCGTGKPASPNTQPQGGQKPEDAVKTSVAGDSLMSKEEKALAVELQQMLEDVSGAGRVEVSVNLATSTYNNYAINTTSGLKTTQEKDQSGGTRQITENTNSGQVVLSRSEQGYEGPVLEREMAPEVAGVLVVAEGADDPLVKASLFRAAQVALGVEPQKVIVLPMKKEGLQ